MDALLIGPHGWCWSVSERFFWGEGPFCPDHCSITIVMSIVMIVISVLILTVVIFLIYTWHEVCSIPHCTINLFIISGTIEFSWRIVAGTAIAGTDYRDDAGDVTLREGETNASIAISLIDNNKPELNKTFRVELYNAKKGETKYI